MPVVKKNRKKAPNHGGARNGSGRKKIGADPVVKQFTLARSHLRVITKVKRKHGLSSMAAALRHILDTWKE